MDSEIFRLHIFASVPYLNSVQMGSLKKAAQCRLLLLRLIRNPPSHDVGKLDLHLLYKYTSVDVFT